MLLCSDGVSGVMTPEELRAAVARPDIEDCIADIITTTRANGAYDNFSFIIVEIAEPTADTADSSGDPTTSAN